MYKPLLSKESRHIVCWIKFENVRNGCLTMRMYTALCTFLPSSVWMLSSLNSELWILNLGLGQTTHANLPRVNRLVCSSSTRHLVSQENTKPTLISLSFSASFAFRLLRSSSSRAKRTWSAAAARPRLARARGCVFLWVCKRESTQRNITLDATIFLVRRSNIPWESSNSS